MRRFGLFETIKYKCYACGCRNKVYTTLINKATGKKAGFTLKCCNCGKLFKFVNDNEEVAADENHLLIAGDQYCIRIRNGACAKKNCPLYNKQLKDYLDKDGNIKDDNTDCSHCDPYNPSSKCYSCIEQLCSRNLFYPKLVVKNEVCDNKFL